MYVSWQLSVYVSHVRKDVRFRKLKNLCELSVVMVEAKKHEQYDIVYKLLKLFFLWVYKLLKLVLILPVATASVERLFSSMNYVKNQLRNKKWVMNI